MITAARLCQYVRGERDGVNLENSFYFNLCVTDLLSVMYFDPV